uniref:Gustatory receptor n=1 Tax=Brugia timori TaxID=42155 RepID=A0A0R3RB62_9BILA
LAQMVNQAKTENQVNEDHLAKLVQLVKKAFVQNIVLMMVAFSLKMVLFVDCHRLLLSLTDNFDEIYHSIIYFSLMLLINE